MSGINFDYLFKILVIGDMGVGKSCLLLRYTDGLFEKQHKTTIGVDFKVKTIQKDGKAIKLQMWDTAGQERFRAISYSYFRGSQGILLVYDVTNKESFGSVRKWFDDIISRCDENISVLIVGNKIDSNDQRQVTFREGQELASQLGVPFIETSAKDDKNVGKMMEVLLNIIINGVFVPASDSKISFEYNVGLCNKETGERIKLEKITYNLDINNFIMKMTCIQEYKNDSEKNIEMVYKFPILNSFPVEVKCEFYDPKTKKKETIFGKVEKKENARDKYDDIVASGNTAVMLELSGDSVFNLNIGNINPGVEVKVFIVSLEELSFEIERNGNISIKAIITALDEHMNSYKEYKKIVKVNGSLFFNGNIKKLECNEKINIKKKSNNEQSFETSTNITTGNTFEIKAILTNFQKLSFLVQKSSVKFNEKYNYCACMSFVLEPSDYVNELSPVKKFSLTIIVDCSGSMSGTRMKMTITALKLLMQSLDVNSSEIMVNIIRFGSHFTRLFTKPKKLDKKTFPKIMKYIEETSANMGGTDIYEPINECLKKKNLQDGFQNNIILITDGEDSNSERIVKRVKKDNLFARFFTFTIGNNVNPYLCDELAKVTFGRSCTIRDIGEINKNVIGQVHHISVGRTISNIETSVKGKKNIIECDQNKINVGFLKKGYTRYMFLTDIPEEGILTFSVGDKKVKESIKVTKIKDSSGLDFLAAQRRIKDYENGNNAENFKKEIESVALQFNLVSSQTSIVLEKENKEKIENSLVHQRVKTVRNSGGRQMGGINSTAYCQSYDSVGMSLPRGIRLDSTQSEKKGGSCCAGPSISLPSFSNPLKRDSGSSIPQNNDNNTVSFDIDSKPEKEKSSKTDGNMTELLLLQTLEGIWKCEEKTVEKMKIKGITLKKVKDSMKEEKNLDFWMTAIVIAYIKENHKDKIDEWKFIVQKSERLLKIKKREDLLEKAQEFLKKM